MQEPRISWLSPEREYSYYTIKVLFSKVYITKILCSTVSIYVLIVSIFTPGLCILNCLYPNFALLLVCALTWVLVLWMFEDRQQRQRSYIGQEQCVWSWNPVLLHIRGSKGRCNKRHILDICRHVNTLADSQNTNNVKYSIIFYLSDKIF